MSDVLSDAVDGFRLAYDRVGSGPPVVLLHGWPGDRTDYREVVTLLTETAGVAEVVVPDLRGFGGSDKHPAEPAEAYSAAAQARGIAGLITELGLDRPVVVGYDVGSRVARTLGEHRPDLVRALVLSPPMPGVGRRVLGEQAQREFWYQAFQRLPLADELVDGRPDAVRAYLAHFWSHWSGPGFTLDAERLEHLVARYAAPGAFTASIAWYRAGSGTVATALAESGPPARKITVPATVLWPEHDPLFPLDWSDRLAEYFDDARLRTLPSVGHFLPAEAPAELVSAIRDRLPRAVR